MAHMRIAVFSQTQREAGMLVKRFCASSLNGTTRWDDFRIEDCPSSEGVGQRIDAFITAEGELVEYGDIAWCGLGASIDECASFFQALFIDYERKARKALLNIYLVDCHV